MSTIMKPRKLKDLRTDQMSRNKIDNSDCEHLLHMPDVEREQMPSLCKKNR